MNLKLFIFSVNWNSGDIYIVKKDGQIPSSKVDVSKTMQKNVKELLASCVVVSTNWINFSLHDIDIIDNEPFALYACCVPMDTAIIEDCKGIRIIELEDSDPLKNHILEASKKAIY